MSASATTTTALLHRVPSGARPLIGLTVDGETVSAYAGDTLFTALLTHRAQLGHNTFSVQPRAGFCLIGACQDCWVWIEGGRRARACTTLAEDGMRVLTVAPDLLGDAT